MYEKVSYCDLNSGNIELYLAYLREAFTEEPQEMTAEAIDEEGIRRRIQDPFYQNTKSILALENEDGAERVVGRLEYHFYGCLQDGYRMAYVDWVYVLPKFRHRGIAQGLFRFFEGECCKHDIDQFYLIRSEKKEADRFYRAFAGASLSMEPFLRKEII